MTKDITSALVGVAAGAVLLGFQPGVQSAVGAGASLLSLGLEFQAFLRSSSRESRRALARIRRRVRRDFLNWSQAERLDSQAEVAAADASLMATLPNLLVSRDKLASAAFRQSGFVDAATAMLLEELTRLEPLFLEQVGGVARRYAEVVISAALSSVFTERAYFEALQPFVLLQSAQGIGEIDRKIDRVLALMRGRAGLSEAEVRGLLRAFFEERVPEEEAARLLMEKARELHALRRRVHEIELGDATLSEGLSTALVAMDKGQYAEADAALSKLVSEGACSIGRTLLATTKLLAARGALAGAQARYSIAAKYFELSAGVARVFDEHFAWELRGAQVHSLMEHAFITSGTAAFQAAIDVALQRVESVSKASIYRIEAIDDLIPMTGQFAERVGGAEGGQAIQFGLDLGRKTLKEWNPDHNVGLKVSIGNNLGALLNAAVEIGIEEEGVDLGEEALTHLREVLKLAMQHAPGELPSIRMNLATALRRVGEKGGLGVPLIREAIEIRLLAIDGLPEKKLRALANSYDSLGNDYRALGRAEGRFESRVFASAIRAHHRALQLHSRGAYLADVAKACLNFGALYIDSAADCDGAGRKRLVRLAIHRCDRGLRLVTQDGAPSIWGRLRSLRAAAKLQLIADGNMFADSEILELGREFVSLFDHAYKTADVRLLPTCAFLNFRLSAYIHARRRTALVSVVEKQRLAFEKVLPSLGSSDFAVHLEMGIAEASFIVADLTDDLQAGVNALEKARGVVREIGVNVSAGLADIIAVGVVLEEQFELLRKRVEWR